MYVLPAESDWDAFESVMTYVHAPAGRHLLRAARHETDPLQ